MCRSCITYLYDSYPPQDGRQVYYYKALSQDYWHNSSQRCRCDCSWVRYVSGHGLEQYGAWYRAGYCWNCTAAVPDSGGKGLEVKLRLDGNRRKFYAQVKNCKGNGQKSAKL